VRGVPIEVALAGRTLAARRLDRALPRADRAACSCSNSTGAGGRAAARRDGHVARHVPADAARCARCLRLARDSRRAPALVCKRSGARPRTRWLLGASRLIAVVATRAVTARRAHDQKTGNTERMRFTGPI
jgi:hypothetical protein